MISAISTNMDQNTKRESIYLPPINVPVVTPVSNRTSSRESQFPCFNTVLLSGIKGHDSSVDYSPRTSVAYTDTANSLATLAQSSTRYPSRNDNKSPNQNQILHQNNHNHKVHWNNKLEESFISIVLEKMPQTAGYTNTIKAWQEVLDEFNQQNGLSIKQYRTLQLKFDSLYKEYLAKKSLDSGDEQLHAIELEKTSSFIESRLDQIQEKINAKRLFKLQESKLKKGKRKASDVDENCHFHTSDKRTKSSDDIDYYLHTSNADSPRSSTSSITLQHTLGDLFRDLESRLVTRIDTFCSVLEKKMDTNFECIMQRVDQIAEKVER
ncbi:Hypothetical protein PP7435_CHR1-0742 [Komagataella phaffii CBS 7435]|uniref:Uncharacterized protein n=2 Tax=Komagataella phaffii TaxID=460519 RepID=C4QX27_KOMPG|nr:Hypothetical protein PAS_chr1-1_0422 [Komagataella phaffii GS115]AOA61026.1 GQ67_02224T0 [Komagataella phaffii]CAH2446599.1 Hypothetical protein BQ9382_C1-3850 [Komagataella phaffii CBS 7435]AOA66465.1 GQ68_02238T0 [Komagataella phaffii GS115]CAY67800.1 Hypothetical protein PAS_chr1-1_0422 [Komagataella phaffii GS115]CCA36884.1 Hypothetical protein PP7435_CHR1-0742 [Komagataella phaffii CBS 7435]